MIAVGEEYTANDFARAWVRKYDPTGAELWTRVRRRRRGNDIAWAVAVDAGGYVYAAGEEYASGSSPRCGSPSTPPEGVTAVRA
jgi:hypothetical protein